MTSIAVGEKVREFRSLLNETPEDQAQPNKHDKHLDTEEAKALHREMMGSFSLELSRQAASRRRRARAEDYYHGVQFTEAERLEIEGRGQTATTLNIMGPSINWMLGTERRNRADGKVLPRRKDGRTDADSKTQLLKYVDDCHHAEMKKSAAFADAIITGLGWLETGVRDSEAGGEPVFVGHPAWRQMVHDSFATELDMGDARYMFRAKWTDVNIATAMFPDRAPTIRAAALRDNGMSGDGGIDGWGDDAMDSVEQFALDTHDFGYEIAEAMRPRVRLIEAWTRRPMMTPCMIGGMFDGEIFDPHSHGHVNEVIMGNARVKEKLRNRMQVHIMTSGGLLRSQNSPYRHNKFPFTPVWGNRRASDNMPYGVADTMIDLQDDINKRQIKATYILNTNKVVAYEGSVSDVDEFLEEVPRPDGVIWIKEGKQKPDFNADKELGTSHLNSMSMSIDMVQQLSGITDESMGRTTNATSGRAIKARQEQGAMTTAHYYDNFRYALQVHGEKQLCVCEQFIDKEKQFRIATPRGGFDFKTVNEPGNAATNITAFKADFQMGEEDWKASNRQASADSFIQIMSQLAPANPQVLTSILDLLVDMLDVPYAEEIASRLRLQFNIEDPDADPNDPSPQAVEQRAKKEAAAAAAGEAMEMQKAAQQAETDKATASAREARAKAARSEIEAQKELLSMDRIAFDNISVMQAQRGTAATADAMIEDAIARVNAMVQPQTGQPPAPAPDMPPPEAGMDPASQLIPA
jgi:hypothetical protein